MPLRLVCTAETSWEEESAQGARAVLSDALSPSGVKVTFELGPASATTQVSARIFSSKEVKMEDIKTKLENYRTAPFDARFPNQNQTRNCWSNYLDFHRCQKVLDAKGVDTAPCEWYRRVYRSLCPTSWIQKWDDQREEGTFPGKI